jgi:hypothetical protein
MADPSAADEAAAVVEVVLLVRSTDKQLFCQYDAFDEYKRYLDGDLRVLPQDDIPKARRKVAEVFYRNTADEDEMVPLCSIREVLGIVYIPMCWETPEGTYVRTTVDERALEVRVSAKGPTVYRSAPGAWSVDHDGLVCSSIEDAGYLCNVARLDIDGSLNLVSLRELRAVVGWGH